MSLGLDLASGHLLDVSFGAGEAKIRPLHEARWTPELAADVPLVLRRLSGDFLCAPFCEPDIEQAPWHGWTANSDWDHLGSDDADGGRTTHRFRLRREVIGAQVEKHITLIDGHPLVYQRHLFSGGRIGLPVAHHLMLRTDGGLELSFSPKQFGMTPSAPAAASAAEGTSVLAYPQRFDDLSRVRGRDGGLIDATRHPIAAKAEDHIYLFDAPNARTAWSAALNRKEGYLFFALKDPSVLPATLLWVSHFGLLNPPFEGRHGDCLGVEEICSNFALGHAASVAHNDLNGLGISTYLPLSPDTTTIVDYTFGCVPVPADWGRLENLTFGAQTLSLFDTKGMEMTVPFQWLP